MLRKLTPHPSDESPPFKTKGGFSGVTMLEWLHHPLRGCPINKWATLVAPLALLSFVEEGKG
jgi:hypothetical protein